jgi:hypothetical protein
MYYGYTRTSIEVNNVSNLEYLQIREYLNPKDLSYYEEDKSLDIYIDVRRLNEGWEYDDAFDDMNECDVIEFALEFARIYHVLLSAGIKDKDIKIE